MGKSADAFRTISEVADWLDTPAHVLRFWESKFSQVKPVKRAGGRRYYRPTDMQLLGGIKKLLHSDGMTIKAVQKLLRDTGVKHVSSLSPALGCTQSGTVLSAVASDVTATQDKPAATLDAPAPAPPHETPRHPPEPQARPSEPAQFETAQTVPEADLPPVMPSFSHRKDAAPARAGPAKADPTAAPQPQPVTLDLPDDPADDIPAEPGLLSRIATLTAPLPRATAIQLAPLMIRLREIVSATDHTNKD